MSEPIFSSKCGKCRQRTVVRVTVPHTVQFDHDGRKHTVTMPALGVPRCSNCGTIALDEDANRALDDAFRREADLLFPEQIRRHRVALGLTDQALADLLGVPLGVFCRWESGGQFQPRAMDRFLRCFFRLPELRERLADAEFLHLPELLAVE